LFKKTVAKKTKPKNSYTNQPVISPQKKKQHVGTDYGSATRQFVGLNLHGFAFLAFYLHHPTGEYRVPTATAFHALRSEGH
jgi:hypothetical protein